jgi:phage gp37-like protein
MAQFGAAGPEIVSKHLNTYFGNLISTVEDYGGTFDEGCEPIDTRI